MVLQPCHRKSTPSWWHQEIWSNIFCVLKWTCKFTWTQTLSKFTYLKKQHRRRVTKTPCRSAPTRSASSLVTYQAVCTCSARRSSVVLRYTLLRNTVFLCEITSPRSPPQRKLKNPGCAGQLGGVAWVMYYNVHKSWFMQQPFGIVHWRRRRNFWAVRCKNPLENAFRAAQNPVSCTLLYYR